MRGSSGRDPGHQAVTEAEKAAECAKHLVQAYQGIGQVAIVVTVDSRGHVCTVLPDIKRGLLAAILRTAMDALREPENKSIN